MLEKADDNGMFEKVEEIASLLHKHFNNELSLDEKMRLDEWLNHSEENRLLLEEIYRKGALDKEIKEYYDLLPQIEEIRKRHSANKINVVAMFSKKTTRPWWVAAASITLIIATGSYLFLTNRGAKSFTQNSAIVNTNTSVIFPAGNKAVLTLANGSQLILDTANNGIISRQDNTIIHKKQDGQLEYTTTYTTPSTLAYNTVTTPRGGKYELILPDGSHVWLNAASSLRFPVAFTGEERRVDITGEAYFEIASSFSQSQKRAKQPFIVSVNNETEVKVLGTHFNINAYSDERKIRTTLLEGSIKITLTGSNQGEILKPGQQAIKSGDFDQIKVITKERPQSSIAWIKGRFSFENTDLPSMMRELSRWYNVDVQYEGKIPTSTLSGEVDRTIPLSELLSILHEMGNTNFKIEGRTVIVKP